MWPDEKLPSLNQYPFQNTLPLAGGGGEGRDGGEAL